MIKRVMILGALLFAIIPVLAEPPKTDILTLKGQAVPLGEILAREGGKIDVDAAPYWILFITADGKRYPLIKDAGSRLFFRDKSLLNKSMQLTARTVKGTNLLRVLSVNSLHKNELFEVYYWCDICSIKRGEKSICECCGGPMELREDPVKR